MADHDCQKVCDDILIEIFLRVPVKSVFRFKCLSRIWNRRLSKADFRNNYLSMRRANSREDTCLLGLFRGCSSYYLPRQYWGKSKPKLSFVPSCIESVSFRSRNFMEELKRSVFVGCSNGVILCCSFSGIKYVRAYYVCNPITDEWLELPPPKKKVCSVDAFFYEEKLSSSSSTGSYMRPSYLVVRVLNVTTPPSNTIANTLEIESYALELGTWKESILTGAEKFMLSSGCSSSCEVLKGRIYWIGTQDFVQDVIVVYDTKNGWEDGRVWILKVQGSMMGNKIVVFGESTEGILHYGIDRDSGCDIARLKKELPSYSTERAVPSSEWIALTRVSYCVPPSKFYPSIMGFHPRNPRFMLMHCDLTVFWYDLEYGEISTSVWCLPLKFLRDHSSLLVPYFRPEWPPSISFRSCSDDTDEER